MPVRSAYDEIANKRQDESEEDIVLTDLNQDIGIQSLDLMFASNGSQINRIKAKDDEDLDIEYPSSYESYFREGTSVKEEGKSNKSDRAKEWFEKKAVSKTGCLKIAKAYESEIGLREDGEWMDKKEIADIKGISSKPSTVAKYLRSMVGGDIFESRDADGKKEYRMKETWRA